MLKIIISFLKFTSLKYLVKFFINNPSDIYSKKLKENGYCVIKNFLSKEDCLKIIEEINGFIKNQPSKISLYKGNYDYRLFSFNKISKKTNRFLQNKFLINLVLKYENTKNIKYSFTLGAKLVNKKNNKGSGGGWHRDNIDDSYPKAILYLSDVGIDNGPFQYIKGSHNFFNILNFLLISKIKFSEKEFSNKIINLFLKKNPKALQTFVEKQGTVIIFDSHGLHRGMPIKKGRRYALTNYYYTKTIGGSGFKHI